VRWTIQARLNDTAELRRHVAIATDTETAWRLVLDPGRVLRAVSGIGWDNAKIEIVQLSPSDDDVM
jgi:hypothetical protein